MWLEILKKDLIKQKGVNIILFFFIMLSTVFLASSVSNTTLVMKGIDNFIGYANVADLTMVLATDEEKGALDKALDGYEGITKYGAEELCEIKADDITAVTDGKTKGIQSKGNDLYIGYTGAEYIKPLDEQGDDLVLKEGETALPYVLMDANGIHTGDELRFQINGKTYSYTVACQSRDIVFGNDMSGMNRFLFCKADYDKMTAGSSNVRIYIYSVNTDDVDETKELMENAAPKTIMSTFMKGTFRLLYVFDMVVAALLIVIGICLILISMMILKFSLTFTIEDNYREIGVMKAIGLREFAIRKIYFVKYLAIVTAGAVLGFFISIPASAVMIKSVSKNMVLGKGGISVNLLCAFAVIVFVAGISILFTGKLKKISAIDAIRNGENGERYRKRRGLSLYKRKHMNTVSFLGLNDILCNKRRYIVLFLTFCISFVLITVPLNTLTTMESDEMAVKFNMNPDAAVYMEKLEAENDKNIHDTRALQDAMHRVEGELREKGYEADLSVGAFFFISFATEDDEKTFKHLAFYPVGDKGNSLQYNEGTAPELENEIAFSQKVMEANGLQIGDRVTAKISGEKKSFIITGTYTDYMQLGESARLNPTIDMGGEIVSNYWKTNVVMDTELSQGELADKLKKELPQYEWLTAQEVIDINVGSVKDVMKGMQIPMTGMLCVLIMLIVLLMMKLFIAREKGQLAMLKSIGYKNRYIQKWLVMRMVWVVILSMVFAVPLSMLSNAFILRPIFAIMGAELTIRVNPLKAYLLYPLVLLAGIIAATVFATNSVRKINTSDMKIAE